MEYNFSGNFINVFKHLSLCEVLKIEKPIRYHETNSASAEHVLYKDKDTTYGIYHLLKSKNEIFNESIYIDILKENGLNEGKFLGSPSFAMNILKSETEYHFHDIDKNALNNIKSYILKNNFKFYYKNYLGDSIETFLDDSYILNSNDFIHIDPYEIFDKNNCDHSFLDVFEKAIICKSKVFMWYGFGNLNDKQKNNEYFKKVSDKYKIDIIRFEVWQSCMKEFDCDIKMNGITGCGIACVNLSNESIQILKKHLLLMNSLYEKTLYNGVHAPLLVDMTK